MDLVKKLEVLRDLSKRTGDQAVPLPFDLVDEAIAALQVGGEREELAKSLASMITEYVEGGIRSNQDWRNGLDAIILARLNRLLRAPVAVTVDDAAIDGAFRTALILAHNICIQDSDRYNADDQIEEANALATVAKRIGGYGAMDHAEILSLMEEAGQKPGAISAALAAEVG